MPDRPSRQDLRPSGSSFRRAGGFSLIELVVVLALMAILTGFALPSLGRLLGGSELTVTANELVFSLQSARSEAIKRAATVGLCASAAPLEDAPTCDGEDYASGWIVYVDDEPPNGKRDALEEVILQHAPAGRAVSIESDDALAGQVLFVDSGASATGAGVPVSGGIRVGHAAEGRRREIVVSANGRIASRDVPAEATP